MQFARGKTTVKFLIYFYILVCNTSEFLAVFITSGYNNFLNNFFFWENGNIGKASDVARLDVDLCLFIWKMETGDLEIANTLPAQNLYEITN